MLLYRIRHRSYDSSGRYQEQAVSTSLLAAHIRSHDCLLPLRRFQAVIHDPL